MQPSDHDRRDGTGIPQSLRASLMMLTFGLVILAYLVAIDHPEWFHIRPVSGAAAAMYDASTNQV